MAIPTEIPSGAAEPVSALNRESSRVFSPAAWWKLYERAKRLRPGGGPALQLFRAPERIRLAPVHEEAVLELLRRALERLRYRCGDTLPAIALRIDLEEGADGRPDEWVTRVFDTGPVGDPSSLVPFGELQLAGGTLRREPPAGPWTGVAALRFERID